MDNELKIPGIGCGPMTDTYEIKILICYLMSSLKMPFSRDLLNRVCQEESTINYFSFCDAIKDLLSSGHISSLKTVNDEIYSINQLGIDTAKHLERALPTSLRDNIVKTAMKIISQIKKERENEVNITPYQNGYMVEFIMHEDTFDLLRLQMFAPDMLQGEKMKAQFMKNPTKIYQCFINQLLENE